MGSSCSSRQSEDDSTSIKSDDSTSRKGTSKKSSLSKTEDEIGSQNNKQPKPVLIQELNTVPPDSPSVVKPEPTRQKVLLEATKRRPLPDFSGLKKNIREAMEGRIESAVPFSAAKKITVCLLAASEESCKSLSDVEKELTATLVPECSEEGWELVVFCPSLCHPTYRSFHSPSQATADFIQDEFLHGRTVLVVALVDCASVELSPLITNSEFETLKDKNESLVSKWFRFEAQIDAYRLVLPQNHFQVLQDEGPESSVFLEAQHNWHNEHRELVSLLHQDEAASSWIFKIISALSKETLSGCKFTIYQKEKGSLTDQLQNLIEKENITTLTEGQNETKTISTRLKSSIKTTLLEQNNINEIHENGLRRKVLEEISDHNYYCKIVNRSKTVNQNNLDTIKQYLAQESCGPFAIYGPQGAAKTQLCAAVAAECHKWNSLLHVVVRFAGLNQNSSTWDGLLYFLYEQTSTFYGSDCNIIKLNSLGSGLLEVLKKSAPERPAVIILDGLDDLLQETPQEDQLKWLFQLPTNVKVILSLRQDSDLARTLSPNIKKSIKLQSSSCAEELVSSSLTNCSSSVIKEISSSAPPDVVSHLYLMILSKIVLISSSSITAPKSLQSAVKELLIALESIFNKKYLQSLLGTLSLTKSGITTSEILSISKSLAADPSSDWIHLRKLLEPLLQTHKDNKTVLIRWSNESVRAAANDHFLDQLSSCKNIFYKFVAKNYENSVEILPSNRIFHRRSLEESSTVYELSKKHNCFFHFAWLSEKIRFGSPFKLLEDITVACELSGNQKDLSQLKDVIQTSVPSLMYETSQLAAQLYGRLKFSQNEDTKTSFCILLDTIATRDITRFLPNSRCFSKMTDEPSNQIMFNAIFRIPGNSRHVIALSDECSQVQVWNIVDRKVVRTLKGINQPRNLEMIDTYKCLLLCGRELRIYDLNEGTFLMKLREVMNQKMPFFGLHNSDHVVALSRSRMYVNMMNLNDGTCVTTFKVGEDRFLSSLVVSDNGKVCVCGDDSQKPSALLVWDLELRKLMYDLRIPHHEFDTRLAAITIEGHYVCSVSKENDDPAPNFIVVYDLQNGTLFKRWKPDVNTISITISTAGTCVIVGLEDSSIMAYDLITGNARWRAVGHTSPPDVFRLDEQGSVVLSYDSSAKDRSLRVWDIHTGESLAAFTPDEKITACEITHDGLEAILALEGRSDLISVSLRRRGQDFPSVIDAVQSYGDEQFDGYCFDLGDQP